jgi:hypothetical protein
MKEILRILFQERKVTFWKVFTAILLTGLFMSAISEFYYYIRNEIKQMADKTKISIVLNDNTEESEIKSIIRKLQSNPKINTIEYISSEQAEFEFFKTHPSFSKDLLTVNPFPPLINFTLLENYFNLKEIKNITKKLQKNKNIIEIKYKKDFLIIFLSVKQNLFTFSYFIASLILIMIILIHYFAVRYNYFNLPDKVSDRLILGDEETKPLTMAKYKIAVTIFILILILISIFITSLIIFALWWFLKDIIIWIGIMNIRRLLTGLFITGGLMLYISIFTAIIMRKKV